MIADVFDPALRADDRVEENLGPKRENPETIGKDGSVELLGEKIIREPEQEHHEPHVR